MDFRLLLVWGCVARPVSNTEWDRSFTIFYCFFGCCCNVGRATGWLATTMFEFWLYQLHLHSLKSVEPCHWKTFGISRISHPTWQKDSRLFSSLETTRKVTGWRALLVLPHGTHYTHSFIEYQNLELAALGFLEFEHGIHQQPVQSYTTFYSPVKRWKNRWS